jgi:hypothetical protein
MVGKILKTVEATLMILFFVDCLVLAASIGRSESYDPSGGGSLIVILLLTALARRLRCGPSYY